MALFTAGIAAIGISRQVGWLATSDEPLLQTYSRQAARRSTSKSYLRQIGIAVHNYHDSYYGHFPAGATLGENLVPQHGWGTALLPFLEHENLHERIDFSQPWDHPANRETFATPIEPYLNPGAEHGDGLLATGYARSDYAANSQLFFPGSPMRFREIPDGPSTTILMGEMITEPQAWGSPLNTRDPARGLGDRADQFGGPWAGGGTQVLFADGSVTLLSPEIDPAVLNALATPDGEEYIDRP